MKTPEPRLLLNLVVISTLLAACASIEDTPPARSIKPMTGLGLLAGYGAYARGMAFAHTGRLPQAKAALADVTRLSAQPTRQRAKLFGEPIPRKLMALAQDMLAGTIARAERRHDEAIALLRKAADADDEFGNDPPLFGGGARLALAGALLDAGQGGEAGRQIAEAMRLNGPSAWTRQGLAQLAALRGARDESSKHADLARAAWKNAEGASLPRL